MYQQKYKAQQQRIVANNNIRAKEVRLIDEKGAQLGVMPLQEGIKRALAVGLDLIQITDKVAPPICKIMDYGKYSYQQGKKDKKTKTKKSSELKSVRMTFAISPHDIETRALAALKFLQAGDKVRVEMVLRGRENVFNEIARKKVLQFLEILKQKTPIKVERDLKREARGFSMIIMKD